MEENMEEKMKNKIYISCLLKDNMIVDYKISSNLKEYPHDYYKDFYHAGVSMDNCDELYEVKWCSVEIDEDLNKNEFNSFIFEIFAREFFKNWKIHPEHWGFAAY